LEIGKQIVNSLQTKGTASIFMRHLVR